MGKSDTDVTCAQLIPNCDANFPTSGKSRTEPSSHGLGAPMKSRILGHLLFLVLAPALPLPKSVPVLATELSSDVQKHSPDTKERRELQSEELPEDEDRPGIGPDDYPYIAGIVILVLCFVWFFNKMDSHVARKT